MSKTPVVNFKDLPLPKALPVMPSSAQMMAGPLIEPFKRLFLYSFEEWESFIQEWVEHCLRPKYVKVLRAAGPGDKGIDIAGFEDAQELQGIWDNFQCKHYGGPLAPSDVWPEIGKLLWHSFQGEYALPRSVLFAAPKGIGTKLALYLSNSAKLKQAAVTYWADGNSVSIGNDAGVPFTGDFKAYIQKADFSLFRGKPLSEILQEHKGSPCYIPRFGGGLPARPKPEGPPPEIASSESRYVSKLFGAYSDHKKQPVQAVADLAPWKPLHQHFLRQREAFYQAESLRVFVRELVEPGTFESLQQEIHDGVIDTHDASHADGYQCLIAVTKAAQDMQLQAHPLASCTFTLDRHGICHQLANDDRLVWTK